MSKEQTNMELDNQQEVIGATESRLLQAMSMFDTDNGTTEEIKPLTDFVAYAGQTLENSADKAKMIDIVEAIRTVSDPEIPINVYDMGLIYKIDQQDNGDIFMDMTLTAPTCPIAGILPQQVADAVASISGVGKVEVKLIWEPAWTIERMTDEAKEMLELI